MKRASWHILAVLLILGAAHDAAVADPPRLSDAAFDRYFAELHVKSRLWASLPWQTNVTRAREIATRERKPIFFVVNTGNCLGFT
jgi:hypothetical protein